MGDQSPPQPVINHFSHVHSLVLLNCPTTHSTSSCAGCEQRLFGSIYKCEPCNYSLHLSCSQAPPSIQHPADTNHCPLYLRQYPAYRHGCFYCNACGGQGRSFSYHCDPCGVDLHVPCAFMPVYHHTHAHNHPLQLSFGSPCTLKCNICRRMIESKGHYRCNMCNFYAHVACAYRAHGDPGRRVEGGTNDDAWRRLGFSSIAPYIQLVSAFAQILGMFFGSDGSGW